MNRFEKVGAPHNTATGVAVPGVAMIAAAVFVLVGCGGDAAPAVVSGVGVTGPMMRPGWNCLASGCHFPDKQPVPPDWGAGGTIFPRPNARANEGVAGVTVILKDRDGKEVRLTTNSVGNFFTAETFNGALDVTLQKDGRQVKMPMPAPAGSCNFCHSIPVMTGEGWPKGRIYAP